MSASLLSCFNAARVVIFASVLWVGMGLVMAENWPAWHGPKGSGVSGEKALPLRWSGTENIRWKVPLPEPGNSSPIVWEKRIFVTQALNEQKRRTLMCLDRNNGNVLWQKGTDYAAAEETHADNPYCAASPVTDGKHVIAWFGSAGVFCYDMEGEEVWRRDLGKQSHEWGYAASPVLWGDLCLIYFGPGERTFLIALNKATGEKVWQVDLPVVEPKDRTDGFAGRKGGIVGSWSTPIVVTVEGRDELILTVPEQVRAFNPKTGDELWRCSGLNPLIYTSPIYGEGVVVGMGGFSGSALAVKAGGKGDVTSTHRLWQKTRTKNRIGSGVIHDGHIYILNTPGVGECISLKTGEVVWEERMAGPGPKSESWSSMVLAGDRIYVSNQASDTIVIRASPKFEILSVNTVGNEKSNSTLAASDGELFLRTHKNLWCISEQKATASIR